MISGIKTDDIISQLEQLARAPITRMKSAQAALESKAMAWSTANTRLLDMKTKASDLANIRAKVSYAATSSDSSISVAATSEAVAGNYAVTVNSISSYDQYTSETTYTDADTTKFAGGTLSLTVGSTTKDIDATGLTLNGLRDAINGSGAGVKAAIVSDGAATPKYRLILNAEKVGTAGKMTLGGNLAGWGADDLMHTVTADDTRLTFGTGLNTFDVTRTGTQLTDVIPGVTLNLTQASIGKTVNVNVTSSTAGAGAAIRNFVSSVNTFLDYVDVQTSFDTTTNKSGALLGEQQLSQIVSDLYDRLSSPVSNVSSTLNTAVQLGLKMDDSGRLAIDETALTDALTNHLEDVYRLFESSGVPSDGHVRYASSTADTKTSGASGYAIHIDAPGRQAQLRFGAALADTLAGDETVTINGQAVGLTAGMTPTQVMEALNLRTADTGVTATLTGADGTGTGNYLALTRVAYGADYHITAVSSVEAGLGGTDIGTTARLESAPGASNTGVVGSDNYVGTINGEAATGLGNLLTSTTGDAKGLAVTVQASGPGDYGSVVFTRGVGTLVDDLLTFLTDATDGVVSTATKAVDDEVAAYEESITRTEESVTSEMTRMRNQFNAMEVALGKLQNQSGQLASLIAQLPTYSTGSA
jgi:flagellar hook-associated protein 2